ncbi:hypothetical protein BaRGS_00035761 [Batillaria attramentaria]|uniref:Uncharacterized protein n=1 Tax=Batillaria attramentaria TaxID=370345 RepID=A0ABD0JF32_9CAEN
MPVAPAQKLPATMRQTQQNYKHYPCIATRNLKLTAKRRNSSSAIKCLQLSASILITTMSRRSVRMLSEERLQHLSPRRTDDQTDDTGDRSGKQVDDGGNEEEQEGSGEGGKEVKPPTPSEEFATPNLASAALQKGLLDLYRK